MEVTASVASINAVPTFWSTSVTFVEFGTEPSAAHRDAVLRNDASLIVGLHRVFGLIHDKTVHAFDRRELLRARPEGGESDPEGHKRSDDEEETHAKSIARVSNSAYR